MQVPGLEADLYFCTLLFLGRGTAGSLFLGGGARGGCSRVVLGPTWKLQCATFLNLVRYTLQTDPSPPTFAPFGTSSLCARGTAQAGPQGLRAPAAASQVHSRQLQFRTFPCFGLRCNFFFLMSFLSSFVFFLSRKCLREVCQVKRGFHPRPLRGRANVMVTSPPRRLVTAVVLIHY